MSSPLSKEDQFREMQEMLNYLMSQWEISNKELAETKYKVICLHKENLRLEERNQEDLRELLRLRTELRLQTT